MRGVRASRLLCWSPVCMAYMCGGACGWVWLCEQAIPVIHRPARAIRPRAWAKGHARSLEGGGVLALPSKAR